MATKVGALQSPESGAPLRYLEHKCAIFRENFSEANQVKFSVTQKQEQNKQNLLFLLDFQQHFHWTGLWNFCRSRTRMFKVSKGVPDLGLYNAPNFVVSQRTKIYGLTKSQRHLCQKKQGYIKNFDFQSSQNE